ncbi:MAG: AAA family ATPase [Patescibacteria group bacterium]|nr:AAA family ATPase [Patescibacteria group bacterium]
MDALIPQLQNSASPWSFFEQLVRFSFLPISELKNLIDLDTLESRFEYLVDYFEKEMAKSDLKQEVKNKLNKKLSDQEKRFLLREEMKIIEKELDKLKKERSKRGEDPSDNEMDEESMNEGNQDIKDFKKRIKKTEYPEEVLKILDKEMERLRRMHPSSPESAQTRDYIEWLLDLPWNISTKDKIDLSKAKDILESQHYGLEEVKTRILEYLAVCKLKKDIHGQVLCFVGPPGTGKTSIGKSIAESMNREFVHFSLGGMRDEAEIRGHRRTYVGSMPGRIVQRLKRVGVNNPVFMLDEIDKIGKDFK